MTGLNLPKGQWVEVLSNITSVVLNLTNFPDDTNKRTYKIHYGTTMPDVSEENVVVVDMDEETVKSVIFNNSSAANIYIMSIYSDGFVVL